MMTAVVAVVILANFVLAGVVGVRLLRMPGEERLSPERLLGAYLVLGVVVSGILSSASYAVWSSQGQAESTGVITWTHAASQWLMAVGYMCVVGFTWRTFHRESAWARWAVIASGVLLVVSLAGRVFVEGFAIRVSPGAYHWLAYFVRVTTLMWMGVISIYYWRQMKKRLALGLAEPMVVNRFALWGIFAFGTVLAATSEPIARAVYHLSEGERVGSAESITQVGGSIIEMALFLTSIAGLVTVAALFLTFFPTKAYARWVTGATA